MNPSFSDRLYADDELTRAKVELAYLRHLQAQDFSDNMDLLTYFGFDFFHDGQIDRLRFSDDFRTLSWRVPTTWITPLAPDQLHARGYLWTRFQCCFEDVVWFQTRWGRENKLDDPLRNPRISVEFRSSEIDTLERELKFYRRKFRAYLRENEATLHSLLIDLAPDPGRIGLIFRRVSVTPEEPLAWEQLVTDGRYKIPWCYPTGELSAAVAQLDGRLNSPGADQALNTP